MAVRIGIDLGTTYSAVARLDPVSGRPILVPNSFGDNTTPSSVAYLPDGTILFGAEAKDEYNAGNPRAAAFYKRDMASQTFALSIDGRKHTPTDLTSTFLRLLVAEAEAVMAEEVEGVVITVPAYFAHAQVNATLEAARMADLHVIATIHEPTAAALSYGLDKADVERTMLFYDLGGGTFDVTIARVSSRGITVLGSDGDHQLGGKDWDDAIALHLMTHLREAFDVDADGDSAVGGVVQARAERVKKQLTQKRTVTSTFFIGGERLPATITQDEFVEIADPLCARTLDITDLLLSDLGLSWPEIDAIILVGGATKMPMVRRKLASHSGRPIESGVKVDEAVALGAAIKANASVSSAGHETFVRRVSAAASHQSAPCSGMRFTVTDVVAHSLGMIAVSEKGDAYVNSQIIARNSPIPAASTRTHAFRAGPRAAEMEIYVLQGEAPRPLDNTIVNKYVATDIRALRDGDERIDVTYSYDADGLIAVSATQEGRSLQVRVEPVPDDMQWAGQPPHVHTGRIVLAVDLSGSMSGQPLREAAEAMRGQFVAQFHGSSVEIGVLLFADDTHWLATPTQDHPRLDRLIAEITIGQGGVGYGNAAHPFDAISELERGDHLIVLTDGVWSGQSRAIQRAQAVHARGVAVTALGFGGADLDFLRQIASSDEMASLTDLRGLSGSFGRIAQVLQASPAGLFAR